MYVQRDTQMQAKKLRNKNPVIEKECDRDIPLCRRYLFALLVQIYSCVISQFKYTSKKENISSIYIKHIKNKYLR